MIFPRIDEFCVEKLCLGHALIRTIGLHHALHANQIVASNLDIVEWLTA